MPTALLLKPGWYGHGDAAGLAAAEAADAGTAPGAAAGRGRLGRRRSTADQRPAHPPALSSRDRSRVRKIEGPDTEPVDLAGVAGPAILKRLAPLLVVILVALIVLRRRR